MPIEDEKELRSAIDRIKSFNRAMAKQPEAEDMDTENMSIVLTYFNTENLVKYSADLVKHSRRLTCWTIVIAVFTVVLGLSTIWSIVDKYLF